MIVPDVNLLVYAYNESMPDHARARAWWEDLLSSEAPVGIPWVVVLGFVRLVTHPRIFDEPLPPDDALDCVESWLEIPSTAILLPGPRHLITLRALLGAAGIGASLTTDAHLAALAIDHQAELHSNDNDFARFAGLRWHNPLAD